MVRQTAGVKTSVARALRLVAPVLALLLARGSARAQPSDPPRPRIELAIEPSCGGLSPAEVRRIASIELRSEAVDAPVHDEGTTRAELSCEGELARIRVLDPLTGKTLARNIALGSVAATARSRLLALAVAELVAASWIELETNPTPAAVPVAPVVRTEDRAAAREVVREKVVTPPPATAPSPPRLEGPPAWRLTGELGLRWLAVDTDPLVGLGARLVMDPLRTVGLELDLLGEHSATSSSLGAVALDSLSVGAVVRLRHELGPFTFHGGPGARLGFVRISGAPGSAATAVGNTVDGAWGAPLAALGLDYVSS
ncbi:MAG TPA: hypothetical protein VIF09_19725, partial [Polyangiaceae bacterium]